MPQACLASLLGPLVPRGRSAGYQRPPADDAERVARDQQAARRLVLAVLLLETCLDRATALGAVRHELRLPLGAASVPVGHLHLVHADDSSVSVGSASRHGTVFRAALVVRDTAAGTRCEYAVSSWHERSGRVCGLGQLQHVRDAVLRGVRSLDPDARETAPAAGRPG